MKTLAGQVALVAGATRGAGRGIACVLGEAGATVYCTGRSSRGHRSHRSSGPPASGLYAGRTETIEETAEKVEAMGGAAIPLRVDHAVEAEVEALAARVRSEQGRLDVLVIDFWGDEQPVEFGKPFWQLPLDKGRQTVENTLWPHVVTTRHLLPLMVEGRRGLVVEVSEGNELHYRTSFYFDLAAILRLRLAYALAEELAPHGVAALALTPGYMRSEATLDRYGVTEENWREGAKKDPHFLQSETPFYVGRAVAALAADPEIAKKSGGLYTSAQLAEEYGFTDVDGARPNFPKYFAEHFGGATSYLRTPFRWQAGRAE